MSVAFNLNSHESYYDPRTGRFLSQDPIGFAGGDTNLYRYVSNKPTVDKDPSGNGPVLGGLCLLADLTYNGVSATIDMINFTRNISLYQQAINDWNHQLRQLPKKEKISCEITKDDIEKDRILNQIALLEKKRDVESALLAKAMFEALGGTAVGGIGCAAAFMLPTP